MQYAGMQVCMYACVDAHLQADTSLVTAYFKDEAAVQRASHGVEAVLH